MMEYEITQKKYQSSHNLIPTFLLLFDKKLGKTEKIETGIS